MSDDPIKRFTMLVLLQAEHDSASELTISPAPESGVVIRYRVEGELYEFSPTPPRVRSGLLAELRSLAKLSDGPYPLEGTIDVPIPEGRMRWKLQLSNPDGEYKLVRVSEA